MTRAEHIIRITGRAGVYRGTWQDPCSLRTVYMKPDLDDEYETEARSLLLRSGGQGRKPRTGGKPVAQAAPFQIAAKTELTSPPSTEASWAMPPIRVKHGAVPARPKDRLFDLGQPWTLDKAFVSCSKCGGGMFVKLDDLMSAPQGTEYLHRWHDATR